MSMLSESIKYEAIILRFSELQQSIDCANLNRYHKIGEIFDEFCAGVERNSYGDNTVQKLADDLQSKGVLSDIANPVRYLYWARAIYQFDPSYDKLKELAKRGFSVTHAKLVFSLTDSVRDKVLQALLSADEVPSTRELESQLRLTASSEAVKAVAELAKDELPKPGDTVAPTTQTVPVEDTPAIPAPPTPKDDKSAKADKGEKKTKDDTPKTDAAAHPLKAIKALEKLVSKMIIAIPDGYIAVTTAEKEGFDSDKAQKNYTTELSNLRAAVDSAIKPLQELKALLDDVKS